MLVGDSNSPRERWPLDLFTSVVSGRDYVVWTTEVKTKFGSYVRPRRETVFWNLLKEYATETGPAMFRMILVNRYEICWCNVVKGEYIFRCCEVVGADRQHSA